MGQDRLMLLIVVYHEHPENEQPGQKTAGHFGGPMEIPKRPRKGHRQQKRRRKKMPPTPPRGIRGVWFRRQYEFYSCSHVRSVPPMLAYCARSVDNYMNRKGVGSHFLHLIDPFALFTVKPWPASSASSTPAPFTTS
jgi:hypothetical protein